MSIATGKLLTGSILDEQIMLEKSATHAGVQRYRRLAAEAVIRGEGAALKPAERMLLHWHKPLAAAIREEKRACRQAEAGDGREVYKQVIELLAADRMAVVTIRQVLSAC